MTSQPDIRIATQADFDSLAAIYVDSSLAVQKQLRPDFYAGYEDDVITAHKYAGIRGYLETAHKCLNEELFVSRSGDAISGFGMFIAFTLNDVKYAEIKGLYVAPQYQRKGVGTALFNYACQRLSTYERVILFCDADYTEVHEWYKKRGVLPTGHFAKMPERYNPPSLSIMRVPADLLALHRS